MPNSATLVQALGAAFCAILCALSGMGGGGMMIGARTAAWAKAGGWVNPYVTDGLVCHFDAEWNAGGGRHDPNATTWIDLSGNGFDMTLVGSYIDIEANRIRFDGQTSYMEGQKASGNGWTGCTCELVSETNGGTCHFGFGGTSTPRVAMEAGDTGFSAYLGNVYSKGNAVSNAVRSVCGFTEYGDGETNILTYLYLNNKYTSRFYSKPYPFEATKWPIRVGAWGGTSDTSIYSKDSEWSMAFRCYNRVLSDEERKHNFDLDAERFGIATTA